MSGPLAWCIFFSLLLVGHALADGPLQTGEMSRGKRPWTDEGASGKWVWWLGGHAAIHGGAVALLTFNPWLGLAEAVSHALIDTLKVHRYIGTHTDQALHVLCKAVWATIFLLTLYKEI